MKKVVPSRVQSPSSIKTYKQCPRKYYYFYIEKRKTAPNIHTLRGNIAHSVLEDFFDTNISKVEDYNVHNNFRTRVQQLFIHHWKAKEIELSGLDLTKENEMHYFEETLMMLFNWLDQFMIKLNALGEPLQQAFEHLTPIREKHYISEELGVRGFIDAIETVQGTVRVMDYKTSKSFGVDDHRLQLAIYSLLYQEQHGRIPDFVGIYFLKGPEKILPATKEMVKYAKQEVFTIHECTQSKNKNDYPLKISRLCKWSTGACDFYDLCFKKK
ncbi:RecB family exonuclease [Nanoarchaeota archaeon]